MPAFQLETCARPNILALQPYRCARDDYADDGTRILLDANENALGPTVPASLSLSLSPTGGDGDVVDLTGLHRYPDPHQAGLKRQLCALRNTGQHGTGPLTEANVFLGVGSDEAIDVLLRAFCVPGRDRMLVCPPTYGMYTVAARANDVGVVTVPLTEAPGFGLDVAGIAAALSTEPGLKLAYLCSPGNPTGRLLAKEDVRGLLEHATWNGVVVLDEAYVDFAVAEDAAASLAQWVTEWPNLVVLQTLSKAFGMAAIRLGAAFASPAVARLLNAIKAPYNVSGPTSALASAALSAAGLARMRAKLEVMAAQRARLLAELPRIPGIGRLRGGVAGNFLLYEMLNAAGEPDNVTAHALYKALAEDRGIVVRFRGQEPGCLGCLRITVGSESEVSRLLDAVRETLAQVRAR